VKENPLTQEEMVISIRGQYVFDGSEFLDGVLGLVTEGGRGDNPNIARGELDSGRTTAHREPSEESGKGPREGNDLRSDLSRV